MFLHSNIKYLRNYSRLTQAQFGKLFTKTRSNIDSYERGNAKPDDDFKTALAKHYGISLEVLLNKDLQKNPGLLLTGKGVNELNSQAGNDAMKAKDELIKEQREQIKFLRQQLESLIEKVSKK